MVYNNEYILSALDPHAPVSAVASSSRPNVPHRYAPLPRTPVLSHDLPFTTALAEEAIRSSSMELTRQSAQLERERELAEILAEEEKVQARNELKESQGTWTKLIVGKRGKKGNDLPEEGKSRPFDKTPNAYELYAAIDRKDLNYIARVRDHAFPLLLQKNAGEFPIIYASRIGNSHKDIVILLCGALSRYVNRLEDDDFDKKETISILRALRVNLKMAIDNSLLPAFDSSLLSSYLQVLIMSEGDIWVHKAVHEVGLWLRTWETQPSGPTDVNHNSTIQEDLPFREGPVHKAESLIKAFCTKELKNTPVVEAVGGGLGVEEYVANSTMDLVLMAAWSVLAEGAGGGLVKPLPTYTFARDLRTYSLFVENLDEHRALVHPRLLANKRLSRQMTILKEVCGDTRIGIKGRVQILKERMDGR